MYKILIIEDDSSIREVLERHLIKWGYLVRVCTEFRAVMEEFRDFAPQLVLLDITLPFYNGYHWCKEIRGISQVPILFLSSAGDDMNQVMALNLGADDFIRKPFQIEVLTAKIQAILRRSYDFGAEQNLVQFGDVTLNLGEAKVLYGAESVELSKNELKILQILMEARGVLVSRENIIKCLWEDESFIDDNTLSVNIARLRKKLADLGLGTYIVTLKGLGYCVEGRG